MKKITKIIFVLIVGLLTYKNLSTFESHKIIYNAKNNYLQENIQISGDYRIDGNIIYNIKEKTTIADFLSKISSNSTLKVLDNNNNEVNSLSIIKTGYILKGSNISDYILSVKGDVLNEGVITKPGIKKIAKHIIEKNIFTNNLYLYSADYDLNGQIKINDITKLLKNMNNNSKTLTATFVVQDNNAATVSVDHVNCNLSNGENSCNITTPELVAKSGYTALGWNTDSSQTSAILDSGVTVPINNSVVYYSVTRTNTSYTVDFNITDSSSVSNNNTSLSCYRYNGSSSCLVKSPTLTANNKYQVVGWDKNSRATSPKIGNGGIISVNSNETYYSIVPKVITVTFDKNTSFNHNTVSQGEPGFEYYKTNVAADSLEFYEKTCLSFNNEGCYIDDLPAIYAPGYETHGFTLNYDDAPSYYENSDIAIILAGYYPLLEKKYTKDTTVYARVFNMFSKNYFTLGESLKVGNVTVEFERGISSSAYSEYVSYIRKLYNEIPILFAMKGKLMIATENTYRSINTNDGCGIDSWGCTISLYLHSQSYVMDFSQILGTYATKYTIVHELSHALDQAYGAYTKNILENKISDKTDLKNLFNSYKNMDPTSRPLSDYAYSDIVEFFAEANANYYGEKYNDPVYYQMKRAMQTV